MQKFKKKAKRHFNLLLKRAYYLLKPADKDKRNVLFIVGCQRSGTTMLINIFDRDPKIQIYREHSKLSLEPGGLRYLPFDKVNEIIQGQKLRDVVAKPLVESQNISKLMSTVSGSKALWVYRDYKDVASSNLRSFGEDIGVHNIKFINYDDELNWRSEGVSSETKTIIKSYFSEDMSAEDAGALFWYARNVLFFERNLQQNENVLICKYEDFVSNAPAIMDRIYDYMGFQIPKKNYAYDVHPRSIGRGKVINISKEIEDLCIELSDRLDTAYAQQNDLIRLHKSQD